MKWTIPHIASAIFWTVWVVNFVVPFPWGLEPIVRIIGGIILIVHVIEIIVFWKRIDATGAPVPNALRILLFGIFHARTLSKPGA